MSFNLLFVVTQARGVVRDLNPKNELQFLRVRAKKHEVMVAFDVQFIVIIIQRWPMNA
jgi:dynein light chain roadblock-type